MIKTIISSRCENHVVTIHDKERLYGKEFYQLRIWGGQGLHGFYLAIFHHSLMRTMIVCSDLEIVLARIMLTIIGSDHRA